MSKMEDGIYGFAIGDALGVPVEFTSRERLDRNIVTDMYGYGSHKVPEGTWSDDTSMTIATLDSLNEKNGIDYDDMMTRFVKWYKEAEYTATGKVFDIGISTSSALYDYVNHVPALKCGGMGEYDNGNGSLMRMYPIACYCYDNNLSEEEATQLINNVSSLTHAHEISKLGCKIYCDYMMNLFDGKNKIDALNDLKEKNYLKYYSKNAVCRYDRILKGDITKLKRDEIKSSGYVVDTLEASIWSFLVSNNYSNAVLTAVNLGSDTDTVGAITGSFAGVSYGKENIPEKWIEKLKNKECLDDLINTYDKAYNNGIKSI